MSSHSTENPSQCFSNSGCTVLGDKKKKKIDNAYYPGLPPNHVIKWVVLKDF